MRCSASSRHQAAKAQNEVKCAEQYWKQGEMQPHLPIVSNMPSRFPKTTKRPSAAERLRAVHAHLLALHEALAKHNAAIRAKFPHSHPVVRTMERNASGWINDAPFQIQAFVDAAEDALFSEAALDIALSDGVASLIDDARKWAGHTPIDEWGREMWAKTVSIVEQGLFDLVKSRADAFFNVVWRLKLIDPSGLAPAQEKFKRKLDTMGSTLKRVRRDAGPTYRILFLLRSRLPNECAIRVLRCTA